MTTLATPSVAVLLVHDVKGVLCHGCGVFKLLECCVNDGTRALAILVQEATCYSETCLSDHLRRVTTRLKRPSRPVAHYAPYICARLQRPPA